MSTVSLLSNLTIWSYNKKDFSRFVRHDLPFMNLYGMSSTKLCISKCSAILAFINTPNTFPQLKLEESSCSERIQPNSLAAQQNSSVFQDSL